MTLEWLKGEDLGVLAPIIEQEGWTPLPSSAMALAAFDENGLAGFHVLRLHPHAEPLWVRPDLRVGQVAFKLAAEMFNFLQETKSPVMVIADSPVVAKMCEKFGMRKVDSPVYIL